MAKLSKEKLKGLIKECLVEILLESSGMDSSSISGSHRKDSRQTRRDKKSQDDLLHMHSQRVKSMDNIKFNQQVSENVNVLTEDPIMSAIFKDTAMNTLQEQLQGDNSPMVTENHSFPMQPSTVENSLDSFADSAKNWATLAFSEKKLS